MTLRYDLTLIVLPVTVILIVALVRRQRAQMRHARVFEGLLDELYARRPLRPEERDDDRAPAEPSSLR